MEDIIFDGGEKEYHLDGYNEKIKSKEIIFFEYKTGEYELKCELNHHHLKIYSTGGYSNNRDGSYFKLDYQTEDLSFLDKLQAIIEKYNIYNNNGYCQVVSGLDPIYGDSINVIYKTNEKIYKSSNQIHLVEEKASEEIYKLFLKEAKKNNYDFNSEKSNVKLYDDAEVEFLQGSWKGKHFGDIIKVEFKENHIKIYVNDKLTDDTEYIIINGCIKKNQLKKEKKEFINENNYEEFEGVSSLRKKNDIMLVAYFTKESYSTADLLKEK